MSTLPAIELTVTPAECDPHGRVSEAGYLRLFERARREQLARGPGMDFFARRHLVPVARKVSLEFPAPAFLGEHLRFETALTEHGRTSFTLRQTARKLDGRVAADASVVFVCLDAEGTPAPVPPELAESFGRRPSARASETRHLAVRGLALALDLQGEGLPVLFVHGFPLDRTMWRRVTATLTGWRRIAPDLRGFGLSDLPDRYSMADYADDLAALLETLHAGPAVVCGLSMGGYVAFELLRRHPEQVRALILVSTRAEPDDDAGRRRRDELIALIEREGPSPLADRLLPQLFAPANLSAMPQTVQEVREVICRSPAQGLVGALQAMRDRPDSRPLLSRISLPTLVIGGREDQIVPLATARALAEAIPGAHFTAIPGAGHLAPLEQPIATSRVIGEFLSSIA